MALLWGKMSRNRSHAQIFMGVEFFLMTTAACFIRQEAPGCSASSSEMEAIKPARLRISCAGSTFEATPRQKVGISASWDCTYVWLMERPLFLSAGRDHYRKSREFSLCPYSKMRLLATHRFFSSRSGLDCFTSYLHFPLLFFKNRKCLGSTKQVPQQRGAEH